MPSKNMSQRNESSSALQIINSNTDRGSSVNALVFDSYKKSILTTIHPKKLHSGTMNQTRSHVTPYKRIIQLKNFKSNIKTTKH